MARIPRTIAALSRREFLRYSGATGIAVAGATGLDRSLSAAESKQALTAEHGAFSELPADFVYLNSGTEGSMPDSVLAVLQNGLKQWAGDPTRSYESDTELGKRQKSNRKKVADFLQVGTDNICLTDNTTMGLGMTLMGLNFRPGDRVVISNQEHNAIRSPLAVLRAKLGLSVVTRPFPHSGALSSIDADELIDVLLPSCDELKGAKALCVSHIYPTTGVRLPLGALRRKADELDIQYLVVDGAQAMGMIDLTTAENNIEHCDFYACPGHKWLNGPPSTGVLYLRNENIRPPEFYPTLSQRMENYVDCVDPNSRCFSMAQALQVRGCSNTPGFAGMVKAMNFATDAGGAAAIENHILRLSSQVKNCLISRSPNCVISPHSDSELSSGLTAFFPFRWDNPKQLLTDKRSADFVVEKLLEKNIQVRSIGFDDSGISSEQATMVYAIRVSTAYFNTSEHVNLLRHALKDVLSKL